MIKQVRSWWKDSNVPYLIGRKKMDPSMCKGETHIPNEFLQDFLHANKGEYVPNGQSRKIQLRYNGMKYEGELRSIDQRYRNLYHIDFRGNKDFQEFLKNIFHVSFEYYINQKRKEVPPGMEEYIEFYETDQPFVYDIKLLPVGGSQTEDAQPSNHNVNVWWVNQGRTFQQELEEGILWAPTTNSEGRSFFHWDIMKEVKVGDLILHYSNGALRCISQVEQEAIIAPKPESMAKSGWQEEGRLIKTSYHMLEPAIPFQIFVEPVKQLQIPQGPVNSANRVNQGYLFRFTPQALSIIQSLTPHVNWPPFSRLQQEGESSTVPTRSVKEVVEHIKSYIKSKGFHYPENLIENFYLSLKSKPFTILAGISGTGKTKLIKLFAEAVGATDENGQFELIPVRPDWSDPADLIGYTDLNMTFRPGRLTELILRASRPENRWKPYFLCLDEMNLARVEHYFSDILSILETQRWKHGQIVTDTLVSKETLALSSRGEGEAFSDLIIPDNLFIVGTVNMDETTHPFSKKVLDRANTIEFNYIQLASYPEITDTPPPQLERQPATIFRSEFLQLVDAYKEYQDIIHDTTEKLVQINQILEEINAQVGFRVRDAICFYLIYNRKYQLISDDEALDVQILQKILPRIQGTGQSVMRVLLGLLRLCANQQKSVEDMLLEPEEYYKPWLKVTSTTNAPYPHSARKIAYMIRRLEEHGFTSFWVS